MFNEKIINYYPLGLTYVNGMNYNLFIPETQKTRTLYGDFEEEFDYSYSNNSIDYKNFSNKFLQYFGYNFGFIDFNINANLLQLLFKNTDYPYYFYGGFDIRVLNYKFIKLNIGIKGEVFDYEVQNVTIERDSSTNYGYYDIFYFGTLYHIYFIKSSEPYLNYSRNYIDFSVEINYKDYIFETGLDFFTLHENFSYSKGEISIKETYSEERLVIDEYLQNSKINFENSSLFPRNKIILTDKGGLYMKAKNKVIAGDYKNKNIVLSMTGKAMIKGFFTKVKIDKKNVEAYEVVKDEHRKSALSGVGRGLVGNFLLGGVGLVAGALSAKSKDIYAVAIQFKNGKQSLLEVDDKIYDAILKKCF